MAKVIQKTDKYTFTFYEYDKDNIVTLTTTLKTMPVTAKRAGELLLESRIKYFKKSDKYIYSVSKNGVEINPKTLK